MIKAVVFDYNGCLMNDLSVHEEAYIRAAAEFRLPLTRETFRKYVSTSSEEKRVLFFGDIPDDLWEKIFRSKTENYFAIAREVETLFPEVPGMLRSLSKKYLLGLISNTPRDYFRRSFPPDLARLFVDTAFGDEMETPKPDPGAFLQMMGRMGVGRDEICYVGDSISDIRMARRAEVKVLVVATGDNTREELIAASPDRVMANLGELETNLLTLGDGGR
jgi:phosphoglycolate phosphatase-like HAD superfamily hydrolase